jgi:NAD(P)-dependent dehydrogenase (short-subunit alcohol dehydrogenase family)
MSASLFDLAGKVAVILGGTSGIGRALALGLADANATVVVSGRRLEQINRTSDEIETRGQKTVRMASDVRNRKSLEELRDAVVASHGQVDILVNAAGITEKSPTVDLTEEAWSEILDTNLNGTLRGCQVFGKHMLSRGYGRNINIGSMGTFVGLFEVTAYCASKAAVGSLTRSLAVEWSRRGVLVNAIVPGVFQTAMNANLLNGTERGREFLTRTPMGRFGKVEELVGAAVYLASDASSFVTGQCLVVDGGFLASGVNQ